METVVVISIVGCIFLKVVSGIGVSCLHFSHQVISIITQTFPEMTHHVMFIQNDSYMIHEPWT